MEKNKTVIFNSSPLINLSHVGLLHLLSKLFTEIFIPEAVFKEVVIEGRKKEDVKEIEKLINDNLIKKIEVKEKELVKAFNKDLDLGESEVIALALNIKSDLVVIDESDARNIAKIYGLKMTGFIGLLIKAFEREYIDSVMLYLDLAIDKGFRINSKLYNYIDERYK